MIQIAEEFFIAIAVSFVSVFTAELGDKTQLFIFLLGTYFHKRKILLVLSVLLGMGIVTAIGYGVSVLFHQFINTNILQIIGGAIFVSLGLFTLGKAIYDKTKHKEVCEITEVEEKTERKIEKLTNIKNPFLFVGAVSLLFVLMELGDKSQIMVLVLFCTHNWVGVFIGAMAAFLVLNGVGILLAAFVKKSCENHPLVISLIAMVVSIGLGVWMIVSGALGV
ncbi:MAG: TMEM165/GDT1 family protein [Candidatus Heimdallarchaeaceae archaeon]